MCYFHERTLLKDTRNTICFIGLAAQCRANVCRIGTYSGAPCINAAPLAGIATWRSREPRTTIQRRAKSVIPHARRKSSHFRYDKRRKKTTLTTQAETGQTARSRHGCAGVWAALWGRSILCVCGDLRRKSKVAKKSRSPSSTHAHVRRV